MMTDSSAIEAAAIASVTESVIANPIDKPLAIAASVIMAVVGIAVFMGIPVIVGALTDGYGLSESEAGYLTAMDMAGATVASLLVSALVTRVNRRHLLLAGLLLAAALNGVAVFVQDYSTLMGVRLLAGFGAEAIFAVIALAFLLSTLLLPLVPANGQYQQAVKASAHTQAKTSLAPWLCLLAVFFFTCASVHSGPIANDWASVQGSTAIWLPIISRWEICSVWSAVVSPTG